MAEQALVSATATGWAGVLPHLPHDVYHVPAYTVAEARHQGGTPAAFCFSDAEHVLLIPLILKAIPGTDARDAVSPYGYSGPVSTAPAGDVGFWRRASAALVDTLARENVVSAFVRLHPILEASLVALAEVGEVVEHGETVTVDLLESPEAIWSETRATHRNEINKARRAGVAVSVDQWHLLPEWTSIYHQTMARLDAASSYYYAESHFAELRDGLADDMHLFLAHAMGRVVAGQIVLVGGPLVHTHLSATRTGAQRTHADKLLYDEVRHWARARGAAVHHIGGGLGGAADGLFAFKAGFGRGRHTFRTWRVIADEDTYDRLAGERGRRSVLDGAFFPAYRARGSLEGMAAAGETLA